MQSKLSKNLTPELLAPAGGYNTAYYAFQAGADAVYFGLKEFSARKGAENFTLDEVALLKGLAEQKGKRIYAALNTLIREEELRKVADLLYDLESLDVDGVIIQDFGLLYLLRRWFPGLPIHASTQMAVHTSDGVAALKKYGVRRFILARELTWEELKRIRETHPDVELEVFIHGALCYSVSGLCLASGLLLGRSGNRGECAQICRSWFRMQEPTFRPGISPDQPNHFRLFGAGGGNGLVDSFSLKQPKLFGEGIEGYFFSCKDLEIGEQILKLKELGIDAFKIEGRLKSPEWVAAVTSYYRALLDAAPSSPTMPPSHPGYRFSKESANLSTPPPSSLQKARRIFSRSTTPGYTCPSAFPYADNSTADRSSSKNARKNKDAETRNSDTGAELKGSGIQTGGLQGGNRSSAQIEMERADSGIQKGGSPEDNLQGFPGLLDPQYPGHRGIFVGKVARVKGNKFCLTTREALGIRDGLQFLRPASGTPRKGIRLEAVSFRIDRMYSGDKKSILSCKAGDTVWIQGSTTEGTRHVPLTPPPAGTDLYQISSHSDTLPQAPQKVRRKKVPVELNLQVQLPQQRVVLQLLLSLGLTHPAVRSGHPLLAEVPFPLPSEPAHSSLSLEELCAKFLTPPADSPFILDS
ncbi:MAG: peptidase U32 family protein, partial [Spirochaetales bacterium]